MKKNMWPPKQIKDLRAAYGETQPQFCLRVGVDVDTLRFWEQGRGAPNGSACLLMQRLREDLEEGKVRPHPAMAAL